MTRAQATSACAGVTLRAVATALGLPLQGGTVQAESEGQDVVRVIRTAAEMQEKDEMNPDLRDRQHDQPDRDTRLP